MPWDEQAFQARIMARAKELGLASAREVMRKAGVSENTFDKVPGSQGRSFNTIEAIAGAVEWTVAEAIGQASSLSLPLMKHAVELAVRAVYDRRDLLPVAIVSGYDVLQERARAGLPIDASVLSTLEAMLRRNT